MTFAANSTSTIMIADPQNLTGASSSEVRIIGTLHGSGNINVIGDQGHGIDGGAGFRLQGTNAVSDYSGTITISNTAKGEIETIVAGPFSPVGTGKIRLEGGDGSLSSVGELNIRNLSGTNTVFNTDVEIIGTGTVSFNSPVGQSPSTIGNLKIGDSQIMGVNKNSTLLIFPNVSLNGGNATFAPGTVGLGAGSGPGFLSVGTISELIPASGLTMSGSNMMTLTGDATYTGPTVVNNGVMTVNGRILNSSGIAVSGDGSTLAGILGGTGVITVPVTITDFGTIQPGVSNNIGTLSISNSLTLNAGSGQGTNTMNINRAAVPNADLIQGVTTLNAGGNLNVVNIGGSLQAGDTFKLYTAASYSGSFATVTLPALDLPLFWNTNNLLVNGTISVGPTPTAPTTNVTITKVTITGTNILVHGTNNNISGTNFHYVVLTTANITNALTNWTPVATNPFVNPDGTFDYTYPIVPGTPRQFINIQVVP